MKYKYLIIPLLILIGVIVFLYSQKPKSFYISFIAVGDTGTGESIQYKIGETMSHVCNEKICGGFVLLGDVIYDKGVSSLDDEQFKTKFQQPYSRTSKPFYIVLGNHDYLGCIECFISYSTMSAKWRMPSRFYKESFNDLIDLFVIDTNNFDGSQARWLSNGIQRSQAPWKIVAGHHPLFSNDLEHGDAEEPLKDKLQKALCNKADLYLAGHAHNLQYLGKRCGVNFVISGGGGARTYELKKVEIPFASDQHGFVLIQASSNKLNVSFYDEVGKTLYTFEDSKM